MVQYNASTRKYNIRCNAPTYFTGKSDACMHGCTHLFAHNYTSFFSSLQMIIAYDNNKKITREREKRRKEVDTV